MEIKILPSKLVQWTIIVTIGINISRRFIISHIFSITIPMFSRPHAVIFDQKIVTGLIKNKVECQI